MFYFKEPFGVYEDSRETESVTIMHRSKRPRLKVAKRDFRVFPRAKVCYSNRNVKFKNFLHMEWSKEKFLKGIVGDKTRLRLWNKHQNIELVFTQLARYNWMHGRVFKYHSGDDRHWHFWVWARKSEDPSSPEASEISGTFCWLNLSDFFIRGHDIWMIWLT